MFAAEEETTAAPAEEVVQAAARTVSVYVRHSAECPKRHVKSWRRCRCPKWLYVHDGAKQRISAKTRSWERAEELAHEIRDKWAGRTPKKEKLSQLQGVSLEEAVNSFLKEIETQNLAEATISKQSTTLKQKLLSWARAHRIFLLQELDTAQLTAWRQSWTLSPMTMRNQHQRLTTFFNYCTAQGWIHRNPARLMKRIKAETRQTLPFSREQYEALLKAIDKFGSTDPKIAAIQRGRLRAMVELLRWSGEECLGR